MQESVSDTDVWKMGKLCLQMEASKKQGAAQTLNKQNDVRAKGAEVLLSGVLPRHRIRHLPVPTAGRHPPVLAHT